MAKNKKGFILYADQKELIEKLSNEDAGQLIKHIFRYVNDENPTTENLIVELAFISIKTQLKRDLDKWEEIKEKRSIAGKKSAEVRKNKRLTNLTSVKSVEQNSTNPTVIVNDNVNVNVNDNVKVNVINDFIIKAKNDFQWCEVIKMQNPKKFNKQITLESRLNEFETWLRIEDKTHNNYSKFIQHFTNWINRKPEVKQPEKHNFGNFTL